MLAARFTPHFRLGLERRWPLAVALLLWLLCGCDQLAELPLIKEVVSEAPTRPSTAPEPVAPSERPLQRDLFDDASLCDIRHRGLAIDVASDWANAHRGFVTGPFDDVEPVKIAAVAMGAVRTGKLVYDFWLDRPATNVFVELRGRGNSARSLSLDVDNLRLGQKRLDHEQAQVLEFGPIATPLEAGRHRLTLRFHGRRQPGDLTRAHLEWIRVFVPDNHQGAYVPPTKHNVLQDVVLADQPRRGLSLRPPGSVRCPAYPVHGTRLLLDVGYWGSGRGVAQVKALTHDGRSVVLAEREVLGEEEGGKWIPLELSLDGFAERLVALEFVAVEGAQGGRVVFAEPRLSLPAKPHEPPRPKTVVLVVLGGLSRKLIPPWGDRTNLPNLFSLASQSVVFEGYRASSTIVSGVMATLLTGARPIEHQMLDPAAGIPKDIKLLGERLRPLGVSSAFFTNVPYTFSAFGFDRGFRDFEQFSPIDDTPATAPLRAGRLWLSKALERDEEKARLLVVHSSGAHPPWDVTTDASKALPPKEYAGRIDPRRAAVVLRDLRNARRAPTLSSEDWERLDALQRAAMQKLDGSFGLLQRALQDAGQWDDALVVFMGDVAMGDPPQLPFVPLGALDEGRLASPLFVKFPGASAARTVHQRFGPETISRAIHEALGLEWLGDPVAPSLFDVAREQIGLLGPSGMFARQGHSFAYYLGAWRMSGVLGEDPFLCDLEVDPTCAHDLLREQPFVAQWMWRALLQAQRAGRETAHERQSADVDEATRAALHVYGL